MDQYLDELEQNKRKLMELVEKLEHIAENADSLFPKKYDFKTRYVFTDRVQTVTQLYDTILRYRSEIAKQIKEQINISQLLGESPDEVRDAIIKMPIEQLKSLLKE